MEGGEQTSEGTNSENKIKIKHEYEQLIQQKESCHEYFKEFLNKQPRIQLNNKPIKVIKKNWIQKKIKDDLLLEWDKKFGKKDILNNVKWLLRKISNQKLKMKIYKFRKKSKSLMILNIIGMMNLNQCESMMEWFKAL